jgi:hypothetical protein
LLAAFASNLENLVHATHRLSKRVAVLRATFATTVRAMVTMMTTRLPTMVSVAAVATQQQVVAATKQQILPLCCVLTMSSAIASKFWATVP